MNRRAKELLACLLSLVGLLACQTSYGQYTPAHPKVQKMVDGGVAYLNALDRNLGGAWGLGAQALVGYTLFKATGDADLPKVKAGIEASQRLAASLASYRATGDSKIVYEASVAAVMLATIDAAKYQPELLQIRNWLLEIQKPHGGFGYLEKPTGDTSQVQYAMLALWTMQQVGMDVPSEAVESCIEYLRATMDPSGSYGYQGILGNGGLVRQDKPTKSLGTAGAGALTIAGDMLGIFGARRTPRDEAEGIPSAFVRVDLQKERRGEGRVSVSKSDLEGPLKRIRQYQDNSGFAGQYFYYYWRYSQERYESFYEIVEGKQEKSPAWYNRGVEELATRQEANGAWGDDGNRDYYGPDICTAFSILFLIRSTQKAIGKLDEGTVHGGYGLPTDVAQIKLVGDRIVSAEQASVESLLGMLEENAAGGVEVGLLPKDLKLSRDPARRKAEVARLSRLLSSDDSNARRIAAKLLGRSDDLNQVPELIYALTDPDPYVPMIAEEGLRLLSRKLTAGKLAEEPSLKQREEAVEYWRQWYLGLRPDYIFIER